MPSALRPTVPALLVWLCAALSGCSAPAADEPAGAETARVVRVVDGDTIRVALPSGEEPVRYIGIDTPESVKPGTPVECFAKRASAYNERLVAGERVRPGRDAQGRGRPGPRPPHRPPPPDGLFRHP